MCGDARERDRGGALTLTLTLALTLALTLTLTLTLTPTLTLTRSLPPAEEGCALGSSLHSRAWTRRKLVWTLLPP